MNKNLIYAAAALAFLVGPPARADGAKPDNEFSLNAAVASDYRYRGISQTRLQPALQGGADYTNNPTGLYAGAWASSITWTKDAGGGGSVELDLYGGKRGELLKDVNYDVGVLSYVYASNGLAHVAGFADAATTEIYGQLGYGPATIKYSRALTNLFGFVDSRGSAYLDASVNVELSPGLVLNLHAGHQDVKHTAVASYSDWKAGLTRDFGVASVALALFGTNASKIAYASPANGKFLGRTALQVMVGKTF